MCFRLKSATASRRRRSLRPRQAPTLPPLAMLDLTKPGERWAHDFLLRATSQRDGMWQVLGVRRQRDFLLCVVRWVHLDNREKPFALVEVSLTEMAVCWRYHATVKATRAKMELRCASTVQQKRPA